MDRNPSFRYPRAYLSAFTTNLIHGRNPYVVAAWSLFAPGLGSLLQNRLFKGFILIVWAIFLNTASNINLSVWYSMTGRFDEAKAIVDVQWLLYISSIYGHQMYGSYSAAVEHNKLFEEEQSKWLRDPYQGRSFVMPM